MDAIIYKIIFLVGILFLALGAGSRMAGGEKRKAFAVVQGIGLLIMLGSGFRLFQPKPDYAFYKIIHLVGISVLALGVGGMMAGGEKRKTFAMLQGIGLLVMLISGFGLLAKLGLGYPHFAIVKTALWLVTGMLPVIFRKLRTPLPAAILVSNILVSIMAYLGVMKPLLW